MADADSEQEAVRELGGEPGVHRCRLLRRVRPDADDPCRDGDLARRRKQEAQTLLETFGAATWDPDRVEADLLELDCSGGDFVRVTLAQLRAPDAELAGPHHRHDGSVSRSARLG